MLIKDLNPVLFSAKLYMDYAIMFGPYTADGATKGKMPLYIAALWCPFKKEKKIDKQYQHQCGKMAMVNTKNNFVTCEVEHFELQILFTRTLKGFRRCKYFSGSEN